ncbi:TetR family transcriptional regulator [Kitasatospora sp. NPDC001540]|uniref:TetR family transcriptional regulator n=1 Tax=Kitasatospora sp. NPDC001540 TaxID=3364014 RepID=UPI0036A50816
MKQERARRTRERILDAAAEEFTLHGYANATVQGVAARTGMTKGALYGHFGTKQGLAEELLRQAREAWSLQWDASGEPGAPALEALRRLVFGLSGQYYGNVRFRAAFRLVADGPRATDGPDLVETVEHHLTEAVERVQREGAATAGLPPETVALVLLAIVVGMHLVGRPQPVGSPPDRVGQAWTFLAAVLG